MSEIKIKSTHNGWVLCEEIDGVEIVGKRDKPKQKTTATGIIIEQSRADNMDENPFNIMRVSKDFNGNGLSFAKGDVVGVKFGSETKFRDNIFVPYSAIAFTLEND